MDKAGSFEYRDRKFGDTQSIVINTNEKVFQPTSTTNILLAAVRQSYGNTPRSVLDLGCGSGIVAIVVKKKIFPGAKIFASDISTEAVALAEENARQVGVEIECRSGSLFEPWEGMQFDLIIDDVAGMSEPLARISSWYPPEIDSDADEDGARWIVRVLEEAPAYLTRGGSMYFPVLTLSDEEKILDAANKSFSQVEFITEQWYPLGKEFLDNWELVEDLADRKKISLEKRGSRWLWATKVYRGGNEG